MIVFCDCEDCFYNDDGYCSGRESIGIDLTGECQSFVYDDDSEETEED